jgi:hypothetical protein
MDNIFSMRWYVFKDKILPAPAVTIDMTSQNKDYIVVKIDWDVTKPVSCNVTNACNKLFNENSQSFKWLSKNTNFCRCDLEYVLNEWARTCIVDDRWSVLDVPFFNNTYCIIKYFFGAAKCNNCDVYVYDSDYIDVIGGNVFAEDVYSLSVYDNCNARVWGCSNVSAYGKSVVRAYAECTVNACGKSLVYAYDAVTVFAYDATYVNAYSNTRVFVDNINFLDNSYKNCTINGCITVKSYNNAKIEILSYDSVVVSKEYNATSSNCIINSNGFRIIRPLDVKNVKVTKIGVIVEMHNNVEVSVFLPDNAEIDKEYYLFVDEDSVVNVI